jgi:thiosulfate/3-mercaptopyruvate sulfurtransferase
LPLALSLGSTGWSLAAQPLLTPAALQPLLKDPQVRVIDIREPKGFDAATFRAQ